MSNLNKVNNMINELKKLRKLNKDEAIIRIIDSLLEDLRFFRKEFNEREEDESVEFLITMRKSDLKKIKNICENL